MKSYSGFPKGEEEALLQNEKFRELVTQNRDDVVYAIRTPSNPFEGTVVSLTDQIERIIGFRPTDFLQDSQLWFQLIHPDDLPEVVEATWNLFEGKMPVTRMYRLRHKNTHEYRWIRDRTFPHMDAQGRVIGIFGLMRDITERVGPEEVKIIAEGTSQDTGTGFFYSLVRNVASVLEVRYAFATEWANPEGTAARTIAFWAGEDYCDNIEYSLSNTPCENIANRTVAFYPERVRELFPKDMWLAEVGAESYLSVPFFDTLGNPIGHMGVVDDRHMDEEVPVSLILKSFVERAGIELERKWANAG